MALPRSQYVREGQEGVYHCFARCVGRALRRFFIHDFFVFLKDKSGSSILTKEFGKCNIPET
jgi:hypothetical protein